MPRLIIISNRLPITIGMKDGELFYHPSAGGLATGLNSLDDSLDNVWVGWPGKIIDEEWEKPAIKQDLKKKNLIPVFLTAKEKELFYEGFSNKVIWPHFHYFTQYTTYRDEYWEAYVNVNAKFAEVVNKLIRPDDIVWVHDYQLMLLPAMIREVHPEISCGFFLHIPFPSYEVFRILPWRREILEGLLGADLIGFHTFGYMRHFLSAVYRIAGHEHNFGMLTVNNRMIEVDVFPMSIDYDKYAFPENHIKEDEVIDPKKFKSTRNRKLILSIDRLDYTKGIPARIKSYGKFLEQHPEYRGKVTLAMIVVPSRSNVDQYQELKNEVDTLVGRLDGYFGTFDWKPIKYFYRSYSFADLASLYRAADIAMITPLRDGMNLVAKEFIASKEKSGEGVLILSEMAGASDELTEALIVNPHDTNDVVNALLTALEMEPSEQSKRLRSMQKKLKLHTVKQWAETFINEQLAMVENNNKNARNLGKDSSERSQLLQAYQSAEKRLIILDYDGTLMNFHADPQAVEPDEALMNMLEKLCQNEKNTLVVISGRDRNTLDKWLSPLGIEMAAEHGVWSKRNNKWKASSNLFKSWKNELRPVLENLVERTPGSFIEEKDYSLAWHYRKIDKDLGEKRIREYRDVLKYLTGNLDLQVLEGNKVVEIKNSGVNKGKAAIQWLRKKEWDFVMAIGDDHTDEDIFKVMPEGSYSIKVGLAQTIAQYQLLSVEHVRELITEINEIP